MGDTAPLPYSHCKELRKLGAFELQQMVHIPAAAGLAGIAMEPGAGEIG